MFTSLVKMNEKKWFYLLLKDASLGKVEGTEQNYLKNDELESQIALGIKFISSQVRMQTKPSYY